MVPNTFPPVTSNQDRHLNPCQALLFHPGTLRKARRHVKIFTLPNDPTDKALYPPRGSHPRATSARASRKASNVYEPLRDRRPRSRYNSRPSGSASEPALRRPAPGTGAARLRRTAASPRSPQASWAGVGRGPGRAGREALGGTAAPAPGRARVTPAGRDLPSRARRRRGPTASRHDQARPTAGRSAAAGRRGPVRRPRTRAPRGEKAPARPRSGPAAPSLPAPSQRRTQRGTPSGGEDGSYRRRRGTRAQPSPPPLPCRSEAPPCCLRVFMMTLRSSRASPPLHNNPRQPLRGRRGGAGALGPTRPGRERPGPAGGRSSEHWGAGPGGRAPPPHRAGPPRAAAAAFPQGAPPGKRRK